MWNEDNGARYSIGEGPIFVLIGVGGGLTGALFNHLNGHLNRMRKRLYAGHSVGHGRLATLLETKQRGWLVIELDESPGPDGGAFEQKPLRTSFVTFLDAAGNELPPQKKKRKKPSLPILGEGPGQPVAFGAIAAQGRPRTGSVDLDAPPPPKRRAKRSKVEFNTGDRVRILEHPKYQGRLGVVVKRNTAWVEVHLDELMPGARELMCSFRKKDLMMVGGAGDDALTPAVLPTPAPPRGV